MVGCMKPFSSIFLNNQSKKDRSKPKKTNLQPQKTGPAALGGSLPPESRRKGNNQWWILLVAGLAVLVFWWAAAWQADNAIIAPSPLEVLEQMVQQVQNPALYTAAWATLVRTVIGLFFSFAAACAAVLLAFFFEKTAVVLNQAVVILQAIPNIAYIILLLFWTGRQTAVILVIFFLLFPIMYRELYEAMEDLRRKWRDVLLLYPQPWYVLLHKAMLPQMKPALSASLKSGASLGFKAGIMAEILASVPAGLGRLMQSARFNLNVAGVLGYVFWMLLLVFLLERLARALIVWLFRS